MEEGDVPGPLPGPIQFTEEHAAIVAQFVKEHSDVILRAVATASQGITDPIGQVAKWLYDRLKEVGSWIASAVEAAVRSIVSGIISALSAARSVIDSIAAAVSRIPEVVVSGVSRALSAAADSILSVVRAIQTAVSSLVEAAVRTLSTSLLAVRDALAAALSAAVGGLSGVLSAIQGAIASAFTSLSSALSSLWAGIQSALSAAASSIQGMIGALNSALSSMASALSGAIGNLWAGIQTIAGSLAGAISSLAGRVADMFSQMAASLKSGIEWLASSVADLVGRAAAGLSSALSSLWDWIRSGVEGLSSLLRTVWDGLQSALQGLVSLVSSAISTAVSSIRGFFDWLWDLIQSGIASLADSVGRLFDSIWSGLVSIGERLWSSISGFWDWLRGGLQWLYDSISASASRMFEWLSGLASTVVGLFGSLRDVMSSIWEGVLAGFSSISDAVRGIGETIYRGISSVFEGLREGFGRLSSMVVSGFESLAGSFGYMVEQLAKFSDYVTRLGAMIMGGISNIASAFANLPNVVAGIFESIINTFNTIYQAIVGFASDPVGWLKRNIVEPVWSGLLWVGEKVWDAIKWMWESARGFVGWVSEQVGSFVGWIVQSASGVLSSLSGVVSAAAGAVLSIVSTLAAGLRDIVISAAQSLMDALRTFLVEKFLSPILDALRGSLSSLGVGSPEWTQELYRKELDSRISHIPMQMITGYILLGGLSKSLGYYLRGAAYSLGHLLSKLEVSVKPVGVGAHLTMELGFALGVMIHNLGEMLMEAPEVVARSVIQGLSLWFSQPLARVMLHGLADYMPMNIPDVRSMIEILRRSYVAEAFPDVVRSKEEVAAFTDFYMHLLMYPRFFRRMVLEDEERFHVVVRDRFGVERKIPLSLRYTMPSPREVVRWLIRDVVLPPALTTEMVEDNIKKLLGMRGYSPEVAKLYYIANFRYPPPTALARFYWRAMSRVLWLPMSLEEREIAEVINVPHEAVPPVELNRNPRLVADAISKYWRWHDYAPFAWYPGFTTDKAVMVELTADLPRRIDLRWMMRWGIIQHMAHFAGRIDEPMLDVLTKTMAATGTELRSETVTPEISLDVRFLARLLQATGYHPYFVPFISVAQAHHVIAEEMTLTRTGFISAFREGITSLDTTEKLMSGMFTITFRTGMVDPATTEWREFVYRKPLFWLPAERRLLQMRSVFDRYVDLWRDFMREVVAGIRRLALLPERGKEMMAAFFKSLSDRWAGDIRRITGVDWAPELDETYVGLWLEYASLTRAIEARIWVRHYIARVMGWLLYRISYGWVRLDDFRKFIDSLRESEWLTEEESKFFIDMFNNFYGLISKEYIPSPLTLATFAEYMDVDASTIGEILRTYNVPEEYRGLYTSYISIKPVKSDFKTLLSYYRRAYVRGVISEAEWLGVLERARSFGFSERELSIVREVAEVEELLERVKERVPTPQTLATLAEYMVIDQKLVEASLDAYRIDEAFRPLFSAYIRLKPVKSDFRQLLTAYRRAAVRGLIPESEWLKVLEEARLYGFTDAEVSILQRLADVESMMEAAKERVPPPSALAALAEYMVIDEKLIAKSISAYRLDEDFVPLYMEYIRVRPVKSDFRQLITAYRRAYVRGVVSEAEWLKVLEEAKLYGFTPTEIAILQRLAELEEAMSALRDRVPTPLTLATLAEYVRVPQELVERSIAAYGLDPAFAPLYREYISVRPLKSDYRTLLSRAIRAFAEGVIPRTVLDEYMARAQAYGFSKDEIDILYAIASLEAAIEGARAWTPSPTTIATVAEYVSIPADLVVSALSARGVPKEWIDIWIRYITVRPVKSDFRQLITRAQRAYILGAITEGEWLKVLEEARLYGFSDTEISILRRIASLEQLIEDRTYRVPTPITLAAMAEYMVIDERLVERSIAAYDVAPEFAGLFRSYIALRPVKSDYRALLSAAVRAYREGVITTEQLKSYLDRALQYGFTPAEVAIVQEVAHLEAAIEESRVWIPSPTSLAALSEYVTLPPDLIASALAARNVPKEWIDIWARYISVRPVKGDFRALLNRAQRALILGVITESEWLKVLEEAKLYGFSDAEISILSRIASLEQLIENRVYRVPTPLTLATIAEYMVIDERLIERSISAYDVSPEFAGLFRSYIALKPIKGDFRQLLSAVRRALVRGVVTEDDWKKYLDEAVQYGFTPTEIAILQRLAEVEEMIEASREYVPTPLTLATLAEYMVIDERLVVSVFDRLRVPEEFRALYSQYIRVRPLKSDFRQLLTAYRRAYVRGVVPEAEWFKVLEEAKLYGFSDTEISILQRLAELEEAIATFKERVPTPLTLATLAEYTMVPQELVERSIAAYGLDAAFAPLFRTYIALRPIKSDYRQLLTRAIRAFAEGVIPKDVLDGYMTRAAQYGFSKEEVDILYAIASLEAAIENARAWVPSPSTIATLSEYVPIPTDLVSRTLAARNVPKEWMDIWVRYISVRPVKSDYRALLSAVRRALRLGVVTPDVWSRYLAGAREYGFTDAEIEILQTIADIEQMIQEASEYIPTPSTLATLAEYTYIPPELVRAALSLRRVREPWLTLWFNAIYARTIADDVRVLLTSYYRAIRYGVSVPKDIADFVSAAARAAGVGEDEMRIRDLAAALDQMVETVPTLSQIAAMSEYISVPMDYVVEVLSKRRVERRFADLWIRYIQVRAVSREVDRVVSVFQRLYERFSVPEETVSYVRSLMGAGGWTATEVEIWNVELSLRRQLRVLSTLIPTLRQFIYDAAYMPKWDTLFTDLLRAFGIDAATYKAQVDYYRSLIRNRRLWRHFSWYRSQLMYAYGYGVITLEQAAAKLARFKDLGLVDDDEIKMILDGFELYKARLAAARRRE